MKYLFALAGFAFLAYCYLSTLPPDRLPPTHYQTVAQSCAGQAASLGYCAALRWQLAGEPMTSPAHPADPKAEKPDLYHPHYPPAQAQASKTSAQKTQRRSSTSTSTTYRTTTNYRQGKAPQTTRTVTSSVRVTQSTNKPIP